VSSANNLYNPSISSAISLINIKNNRKQWLVKLTPEKTEIVYFSTRSYPLDLYFSIDNDKIKPVDGHKHLGVTLSADCKWSKHMNNVVVKTSRQIAVLHKIKVKVSRNLLENIYMTLIMLIYWGKSFQR
jgi:hypothetical protein